jgi:DNA primase
MVSPEKGIWHDFSSGKGGDIFTFVMEVEGVGFREALEKLARQAGVDLAKYGGEGKDLARRKARVRECLEWAAKYYQVTLTKNRHVMEYVFYKRNLNRKTVGAFRVGYAPVAGRALVEFLTKKGFARREMEEAGLLNRFGGDLFRGRMMVPLMDGMGAVIGFTGRVVGDGDSDGPKYLNTPETLLYNKGRHVFGLSQAKESIRKSGYVVVVEGNMDVISSHQAGVGEAVATAGTAMTEGHLKALARLSRDIRLAYDGDRAGVAAAERAIMLAGKMGVNIAVISDYGGAKDPDELIQQGEELWRAAVAKPKPAVDWLLGKYEERLNLRAGAGKREYSDVAMKLIRELGDSVEREHYEKEVAGKLGVSIEALRNKRVEDEAPRRRTRMADGVKERFVADGEKILIDNLLAIVMYGEVGGSIDIEVPTDYTRKEELKMVFEHRYAGWEKDVLSRELADLMKKLENAKMRKQKGAVQEMLAAAEARGDEAEVVRLLGEINELNKGRQ